MEGKRSPWSVEADKNQEALGMSDSTCVQNFIESKGTDTKSDISLNKNNLKFNLNDGLDNNKFNIIYTNADCLTNKVHELHLFLSSLDVKPTAIVITEVNAKVSSCPMQDFEFNLDGYVMHSINIGVNKARGIIIYVDRNFTSTTLNISCNFSEYLCVSIRNTNNSIVTICGVYRSPNSDGINDSNLFKLLSTVYSSSHGKVVMLGDFNYCSIDWNTCTAAGSISGNSQAHKFLSSINKNYLTQHVLFPTRVRGVQTPHILDLVLTSENFIEKITDFSPLGKSDHCILHVQCNLNCEIKDICNSVKYNYNKCNYDDLKTYVSRALEANALNSNDFDVNSEWLNIKQSVDEGIKKFAPCYSSNSWRKKSSWKYPINSSARKHIKEKHKLWKKYLTTRDPLILNEYKHTRNLVRKESRNTVQNIQRKVADSSKSNPKSFWKFIKSKTSITSTIGDIKISDGGHTNLIIKEDQEKAQAFADHFSNLYTIESNSNFSQLPSILPLNTMPEVIFTVADVHQQLVKLKINKSPGPDLLHPRVLHELGDVLAGPLTHLFSQSLNQCVVPDDWKMSTVTPVFKKGKKDCINNYRPISLTCIACKIMESVIRNKIMEYFFANNLFSRKQYGFIKGRSTVLQLLQVFDDWSGLLENKGQIDVIYTDLEKAFDKVPHKRLLSKLFSYGINANLIKWIESFLCYRFQRIKINSCLSECKPVLSGIPQGSVLGPLLFVIFINDLPLECSNMCEPFLFADDAKLYKHIYSEQDSIVLNESCQKLFKWCENWLMNINIDKCKVLSFAHNKNEIIHFDYGFNIKDGNFMKLEHVDNFSDLGVVMDSELTFENHIYNKINMANKMLGIINRNFKDLDKISFILLYKSLVRSHLEFAHSVWSPYKKGLIYDIEKVQKRATKMVHGCKGMNYMERLQFLNLPTLKFRRIRGDMVEVFKMTHNLYDQCTVPTLTRNPDTRTRGNSFKLKVDRCKYDLRKYSFCNRVTSVWNSLPDNVVCSESLNSFKNSLDKFWSREEVIFNYEASLSASL
jgi:hypothetical protein